MNESIKHRRSIRRLGISLAFCSALGGTVIATARPAQAAFDPVTATEYVELAYSLVKLYKSIFGGNGRNLSEQLDRIQAAIVAELRVLRNDQLQANARSVFILFSDLSDNSKSDPTNASMWSDIRTLQQTTADAFYQVLQGSDTTSQYALLPAYNTLLATGTAVLSLKREIWSGSSSSWRDFYNWTQPGIRADYRMIGSKIHQCSPGSNPGYLPMPLDFPIGPAFLAWAAKMDPGKYKDSVLWRKKLANKNVTVDQWSVCCTDRENGVCHNFQPLRRCNPATKECGSPLDICVVNNLGIGPVTRIWSACDSDTAPVACAEQIVKPDFDNDPVVKVVRSSMKGIMTVSGGNESDSSSKNNPLVPKGKIVDPWVPEASCSSPSRAYPQVP